MKFVIVIAVVICLAVVGFGSVRSGAQARGNVSIDWQAVLKVPPIDLCQMRCKPICLRHCEMACEGDLRAECVPKCQYNCMPACVTSCRARPVVVYLPLVMFPVD